MSEIRTNKKVAKIMPGRDYHTGDLKAYTLQNTIIVGREGSGIDNVLNNILLHLVEDYSSEEVCIQYFPAFEEYNPWLNRNRRIPHFVNQIYDYNTSLLRWKEVMCACCSALFSKCPEPGMLMTRNNVIIVELTPEIMNDEVAWSYVKLLLRLTDRCGNLSTIVVSRYSNARLVELEKNIGLRILTRNDNEISEAFLGCNLSSNETQKSGFVWVTEREDFYNKKRLEVYFKPDSYISKVCKYLSSAKDTSYDYYRAELERYLESEDLLETLKIDTPIEYILDKEGIIANTEDDLLMYIAVYYTKWIDGAEKTESYLD